MKTVIYIKTGKKIAMHDIDAHTAVNTGKYAFEGEEVPIPSIKMPIPEADETVNETDETTPIIKKSPLKGKK